MNIFNVVILALTLSTALSLSVLHEDSDEKNKMSQSVHEHLRQNGIHAERIGEVVETVGSSCRSMTVDLKTYLDGSVITDYFTNLTDIVAKVDLVSEAFYLDLEKNAALIAERTNVELAKYHIMTGPKNRERRGIAATVITAVFSASVTEILTYLFSSFKAAISEKSDITEKFKQLAKELKTDINKDIFALKYQMLMADARGNILTNFRLILDELFHLHKISPGLFPNEKMAAETLEALLDDDFYGSAYEKMGVRALSLVTAIPYGIIGTEIQISVCLPLFTETRKNLYRTEPYGFFDLDETHFLIPHLPQYVTWSEGNLSTAKMVEYEKCQKLGSLAVCPGFKEMEIECNLNEINGCGLTSLESGPEFLHVRYMETAIIIATKNAYAAYSKNGKIENYKLQSKIFALQLPENTTMTFGSRTIRSHEFHFKISFQSPTPLMIKPKRVCSTKTQKNNKIPLYSSIKPKRDNTLLLVYPNSLPDIHLKRVMLFKRIHDSKIKLSRSKIGFDRRGRVWTHKFGTYGTK